MQAKKKEKRQIGDDLRICLHVAIVTVVSSRFNLLIVFTLSLSSIKEEYCHSQSVIAVVILYSSLLFEALVCY